MFTKSSNKTNFTLYTTCACSHIIINVHVCFTHNAFCIFGACIPLYRVHTSIITIYTLSILQYHVHDSNKANDLKGYVKTRPGSPNSTKSQKVYALDCEMVSEFVDIK